LSGVDFLTALGRLLRDAKLREDFARDAALAAEQIGVAETDRAAFERLDVIGLEAQATVLMRKRYRTAQRRLPRTCAGLNQRTWPSFANYARGAWPASEATDALAFAEWLLARGDAVDIEEINRLRFSLGTRRIAIHLLPRKGALPLPAGQLFMRTGSRILEYLIRFGW